MDTAAACTDIVLSQQCQELTSALLPPDYLSLLFLKYPDLDRTSLSQMFQNALVECKEKLDNAMIADFCIITSELDVEIGRNIKFALEQELRIKGCMIDDLIEAGQDILSTYENMMEYSGKNLFLITRNFTADRFCRRIQNGAIFNSLMQKAKNADEKCVPVILESHRSSTRVPLGLSGLAGIIYDDAKRNVSLFQKYFTKTLKERMKLHRKYFEQICNEEVQVRVREHFDSIENRRLAIEDAQHALAIKNTPEPSCSTALVSNGTANNIAHGIQQACAAITGMGGTAIAVNGTSQEANVNVTGDSNHIGTKIINNITVVVGQANNNYNDSAEESDDNDIVDN